MRAQREELHMSGALQETQRVELLADDLIRPDGLTLTRGLRGIIRKCRHAEHLVELDTGGHAAIRTSLLKPIGTYLC